LFDKLSEKTAKLLALMLCITRAFQPLIIMLKLMMAENFVELRVFSVQLFCFQI